MDVALSSGLSLSHYWRIEQGKVVPSVATLYRIAQALTVPIEELLHNTDVPSMTYRAIPTGIQYGICIDETATQIADISVHFSEVNQLARLFTSGRLSPLHFADAIEDFLAQ